MKFTVGFSEEVDEKYHQVIIEMYVKGLIKFEPGYKKDVDGKVIIYEISVVPMDKYKGYAIELNEKGIPVYVRNSLE